MGWARWKGISYLLIGLTLPETSKAAESFQQAPSPEAISLPLEGLPRKQLLITIFSPCTPPRADLHVDAPVGNELKKWRLEWNDFMPSGWIGPSKEKLYIWHWNYLWSYEQKTNYWTESCVKEITRSRPMVWTFITLHGRAHLAPKNIRSIQPMLS